MVTNYNLEVFEEVYFKNVERISKYLNLNIPSKVFHGASLDLVFSGESISQIHNFAKEFFVLKCKDTPYCGCPQKNFAKK